MDRTKRTEARRNVRVPFRTQIRVTSTGPNPSVVESDRTRDISLTGLYCYTGRPFEEGTACDFVLELAGASPEIRIEASATVARVDDAGMALMFEEMDLDSLVHLKQLLYYNTGEPDRIDNEMIARGEGTPDPASDE